MMKNHKATIKALKTDLQRSLDIKDTLNIFDRFTANDSDEKKKNLGRTSFVVTAKGQEVETGFKVVDINDLIISNSIDGRINIDYPTELQPRDRTRKSSILQISKMANNLRPTQLADSGLSSHGAPIVGQDLVVESGNGRSMAIKKAYADNKASDYKQYLINNAPLYGLSAEKIKSIESPILVRVRVTDVDRVAFARDSNLSDLQSMSASETAYVDAERIDHKLMSMFRPSETGSIINRDNDPFLRGFLNEIGDGETAGLLTADGRYTKQLIDRVQSAIFAKAYKNEKLVSLMTEEPDPDIRNILTALNTAANSFVEMQMLSGEVHKQQSSLIADTIDDMSNMTKNEKTDLAEIALNAIVNATEIVRQAKISGQNIAELLNQNDLFSDSIDESHSLAMFIATNNRSSKRMGQAFKALADEINKELVRSGSASFDLFGDGEVGFSEILNRVNSQLEIDLNGGQSGLF